MFHADGAMAKPPIALCEVQGCVYAAKKWARTGYPPWAAASLFYLLQACLGLSIHAPEAEVRFSHPVLPEFLQEVQIKNLKIGAASIDLQLQRHDYDVSINVVRKEGDVHVTVIK